MPTKKRRYQTDILREMNVAGLVEEHRSAALTFDELCYQVRGRPYRATRAELQRLSDTGLLSRDEFSYLNGELLCWHLHAFF